jgi:hypothetical protein
VVSHGWEWSAGVVGTQCVEVDDVVHRCKSNRKAARVLDTKPKPCAK